jgi:hypothetical protein
MVENQLLQQQSKPPHQQDFDLQKRLTQQHHQLLLKDEKFHLQRAKKNWATQGDRNTSFFHQSIIKRHRKNRITYLQNPDGTHSTTPEQLADTLIDNFQQIFATTTLSSVTTLNTNANAIPITDNLHEGNAHMQDAP